MIVNNKQKSYHLPSFSSRHYGGGFRCHHRFRRVWIVLILIAFTPVIFLVVFPMNTFFNPTPCNSSSTILSLASSSSLLLSTSSSSSSSLESLPQTPNFHNLPWPRIAWLMSYPNSGTSYTLRLIARGGRIKITTTGPSTTSTSSNTSSTTTRNTKTSTRKGERIATASNYGQECNIVPNVTTIRRSNRNDKTNGNGTIVVTTMMHSNVPVRSSSPGGPFLLHVDKEDPEVIFYDGNGGGAHGGVGNEDDNDNDDGVNNYTKEARTEKKREYPKYHVLTKTHCGGRCVTCTISSNLETPLSFAEACASGSRMFRKDVKKEVDGVEVGVGIGDGNGDGESTTVELETVKYDPRVVGVSRVVHLVRDPFENVRSNYRLYLKKNGKKNKTKGNGEKEEEVTNHSDKEYGSGGRGVVAFKEWCQKWDERNSRDMIDDISRGQGLHAKVLGKDVVQTVLEGGVPCVGFFYMYAQWHSLALRTSRDLDVSVLVIHYEDYAPPRRASIVRKLAEFLLIDVDPEAPGVPSFFVNNGTSSFFGRDAFTSEERKRALDLVRKVTGEYAWERLSLDRYSFE